MLRAVLVTITFLFVSGGAHFVVARWAMRSFPRLEAHRRVVLGVAAALVLVTPLARWVELWLEDTVSARVQAFGMVEATIVILGALPLALLRAFVLFAPRPSTDSTRDGDDEVAPALLGRRELVEKIGGAAVLGATSTALGWGIVRGRHAFVVEEIAFRIPGLPRALDGYTIAQVSDMHTGLFVGPRELAEGLSRVREIKPDLVVATGDLVDYDERFIALMARSLADLPSRDGVYAILGNHDYYTGAPEVAAGLRAAGVRLLVNEGVVLRPDDGGGFALLGVADLYARMTRRGNSARGEEGPRLDLALRAVPPHLARILLAHQPRFFKDARGQIALQLSGHTHGGQINPGFRPAALFMDYVAGRYDEEGSSLYVNRGFGVAGPPSRVGAPPEITKIVLVAG